MDILQYSKILRHCHLLLITVSSTLEFFFVFLQQLCYCIILKLVSNVSRRVCLCIILANIILYCVRNES